MILMFIGLILLVIIGCIFLFVGAFSFVAESFLGSTSHLYPWILIVVGSAIIWLAFYLAPFKFVLTST